MHPALVFVLFAIINVTVSNRAFLRSSLSVMLCNVTIECICGDLKSLHSYIYENLDLTRFFFLAS